MIYDRFGRPLTSIRISITQRCNLNCIYCHEEGILDNTNEEMTPGEISRITQLCAKYGVKKVKMTGGEPLLRNDVCEIVNSISKIPGVKDVSMTTNGIFLEEYAAELKRAGLDRINVSLDTLKPEVFAEITRSGEFDKVVVGIEKAIEVGLKPVKLNMVVMKGINEKEIRSMLNAYSRDGVVLQLIELMDINKEFFGRYFYSLDQIEREFEEEAIDVLIRKFMQDRRKYILDRAEVEIIKPMHNTEFCAHCTRMRITADGKFKPCLMRRDNHVDFLTPMRDGAEDAELEELFKEAVRRREPYFKGEDIQ
jgi:cyclic pyranopterin phosphate synthase